MIVNYTEQGWEIIMQRAHGLLAAQVAMQWKVTDRPRRWTETVIAIAGHDDAQIELEQNDLLTPQGGPVNFAMKIFEEDHCQRLIDFSLSRSRYNALLSSIHLKFLHHNESKTNPKAKAFLHEQEKLQKEWCAELKLSKKEVDKIYGILEWCDAFSLLLCQNGVQPEQRIVEISKGAGDNHSVLKQNPDGSLNVSPWPFEETSFEIHVEKRIIKQIQFKSIPEFKKVFLDAEVIEQVWLLSKD